MPLPRWISTYLDDEHHQSIENAIAAAEANTSGEIVPMIVRRSSTIGHVPVVVFAFLVIVFLAANTPAHIAELIGHHWGWLIVEAIVIYVTAIGLSLIPAVQRLFTPKADQVSQVHRRAEIEFFEAKLNQTQDATGILLFVSMLERRAVVLADEGIAEKLPQETWDEVIGILLDGIKHGDLTQGFVDAIGKCGNLLAPHFPIQPNDENELRDHLVIKE